MRGFDVRVSRPDDEIDGVGVTRENRRKRVDDVVDALVRREEAERENDRLLLEPEPIFVRGAPIWRERYGGNAVRNEVDLVRHPVDVAQNRSPSLAHHDDALGELDDLVEHRPLLSVRLVENRVERRDDGHSQLA